MNQEIILADSPKLPIFRISDEELLTRDAALAASALIGKVSNAAENLSAVRSHIALVRIVKSWETARKISKELVLGAGRQLDRAVYSKLAEVEKEIGRLEELTSMFQLAERRRMSEERELQERELARINREKNDELAKATTIEEVQKIQERAQAEILIESKPIIATRAAGQRIKEDWEITVINPWELAKFHPDCVRIEPLLTPIKNALNAGIAVKGIRAEKIIKTQVRAGAPEIIEV